MNPLPSMTLPTIHLNGTSAERLIEALCQASAALDSAYAALKETSPNGRDYYPQGPTALASAEREHFSRLARVDSVKDEIDRMTLAIAEIADKG